VANTLFYIAFVTVLMLANIGLHLYLWRCLVRSPRLTGWLRVTVGGTIVLFAVLVPINFGVSRLFVRDSLYPLLLVIWTWLGVAFYLLTIFIALDLFGAIRGYALRRRRAAEAPVAPGDADGQVRPDGEVTLDRRLFVSRAIAGSAAVAATGITAYGVVSANGDFQVPEVPVKLERLPRQLEGFRIVHISDVHIGPVLDGRFIDHIVETANKLKPDLVCITGDLVDGSVRNIGDAVGRLANLKSNYGVAFSTGNHEYYSGVEPWLEFLRGLGFHVLGNERMVIGDAHPGGASFDLAGIHDRQGGRFHPSLIPNLDAALHGRDPDRELVLMAHQPAQIAMAQGKGVGLQLSGHTHGGQVWPFGLATRLVQPYLKGHHHHEDGTQIYVSCGTGYWGPPLRVGAPPEVASIILTS
jgi:predicted MPP superfamily phosphohydrolase